MKRIPLKHVATLNDEVLPETFPPNALIKYAEVSDVSQGRPVQWKEPMPFVQAPSRARRIVKHGDILMSTVRTYLRAVTQVEHPPTGAVASTGFAVVRPRTADSKYLGYVLQSDPFIDEVVSESVGVSYPAISSREIARIKIPFPETERQKKIADFLDRETAEIDAFIADQERLIELLEERRSATITHAVTKGLDPHVPVKDSGVEWLGKIPEHWEMCSLRYLLQSPLKYGANEPATSADPEQVRYLRITDFDQRGQLRDETFRSLPEEIARNYMVLPKDVLLARSGATVGKAFIVPEDSPPASFAGYLIRVDVSREKILPEYFFLYTQTASFEAWKNLVMIQATIQNISAEKYASLKVPLPPLAEQRHIVQYLDREISEIDAAVLDAREAIALSKERRAALISAAVTGQIDVTQMSSRGSTSEVLEQGVRV